MLSAKMGSFLVRYCLLPLFMVIMFVLTGSILTWISIQFLKYKGRQMKKRSKYLRNIMLRTMPQGTTHPLIVAFFHPYCHAGGGGERVLWAAVRATQVEHPDAFVVVYSGDIGITQGEIVLRARNSFGIELQDDRLKIVLLKRRYLVSADSWPRFTLIGQSLGSVFLAYEALSALAPDIFIDTMGYAFTYPLVHYTINIPVVSYTHYPTITVDMFAKVSRNNIGKLLYWRLFASLYARTGQFADVVMANSSWTMSHLSRIWKLDSKRLVIVYPPCDTKALSQIHVDNIRKKDIVCVAQFRPEKDHATIIKAFAILVHDLMPELACESRLVLIGTVRNEEDRKRLRALRTLTEELDISQLVEIHEDLPWPQVIQRLEQSWIGTNAMWNEHFGIGVVEYMAAGLIAVVHDSAGPRMDIVVEFQGARTGFRATDVQSFAECYASAMRLERAECVAMRRRAQKSSARFSEEVFASAWQRAMIDTMKIEKLKRVE